MDKNKLEGILKEKKEEREQSAVIIHNEHDLKIGIIHSLTVVALLGVIFNIILVVDPGLQDTFREGYFSTRQYLSEAFSLGESDEMVATNGTIPINSNQNSGLPTLSVSTTSAKAVSNNIASDFTLYVTPTNATISSGQTIEIIVRIKNAKNLFAQQMSIEYNDSVLEYVSAKKGSFLSSDSESTFFISPEESPGTLSLAAETRLSRTGVDGPGDLLILKFIGIKAGISSIGIKDAKLVGADNQSIPSQSQGATIQVD